MPRSKTIVFFLGLLAFWALLYARSEPLQAQKTSASQPTPSPRPTPSVQVDTQQHSFFDATSKWPTITDPRTGVTAAKIYVCWENPDQSYLTGMNLVRKSVVDSWEEASALRFTGWQKCAPENRGIRILIDDSGPHTKGLGSNLDGKPTGMVLNFTFNNWSTSCKTSWDFCVKSIAVHAIGFAHEQNRPDAPGECQKLAQGSNGTLLLTPYDPDSVMNYCNAQYNNNGVLSRYDTEAVQKIYGVHPRTGQIER